ncbi:MAG: hypothetical protein NDJ90_02295 [Oligoflexia bacterium]|nr:hypothetical protein [Oligoflexia bacterium]
MKESPKPIVVVGDGWAALGAVGFLAGAPADPATPIVWIAGTGSRLLAPLPSLESAGGLKGAEAWQRLAATFGIDCGEIQTGSYLREFRHKSFREVPEDRKEELWAPERFLAPLTEARFATLTVNEIDAGLREELLGPRFAQRLERIEGVPLAAIRVDQGRANAVVLGSGREIACERIIYADRWNELPKIQGLPKGLPFTRKRDPIGVLQAMFVHGTPVGAGLSEGFFGALHREAGEEQDRHLWGHFASDGSRSVWTICIGAEEAEDNHAISKRLRRLKSGLDKMFTGAPWVPADKSEFMANVLHEQVRFEEAVQFSEGTPPMARTLADGIDGLGFLTDGYGPSSALHQVALELGVDLSAPATVPN